jgi:tagatose-6-phosphate ketose/aldose isomerase
MADARDIELALPFVAFAQSYALRQSLRLGLRPDTPSVSGTVNRVVHGVTIYPWQGDSHVSGH